VLGCSFCMLPFKQHELRSNEVVTENPCRSCILTLFEQANSRDRRSYSVRTGLSTCKKLGFFSRVKMV
jgi:hypothetical protein